jgi:hypothetical protein
MINGMILVIFIFSVFLILSESLLFDSSPHTVTRNVSKMGFILESVSYASPRTKPFYALQVASLDRPNGVTAVLGMATCRVSLLSIRCY